MRRGRKLLGASIVALLLALATTAYGVAAEGDPGSEAVLTTEERSTLEDELEKLEPKIAEANPSTFGGLWVVGEPDWNTVNIAFTDSAEKRTSEAVQEFSRPDLVRAVSVDDSLEDLLATQKEIIEDREAVREGEFRIDGVDDSRYDIDVNVYENRVEVFTEPEEEAVFEAAFDARYGKDVEVLGTGVSEPEACTRNDCENNLRSGLKIYTTTFCSSGFTVLWNGAKQVLSAAHCSGTSRKHGGTGSADEYGTVSGEKQQGKVDAERHRINSGWNVRRWIFVNNNNKDTRVTGVSSYAGFSIGTRVCKSGATTDKTCGEVRSKYASPNYVPNSTGFLKTKSSGDSYCAEGGDSGAGVYKQNNHGRAVGIHSGGPKGGTCSQPGSDYGFIGHITHVERELGVTVLTS